MAQRVQDPDVRAIIEVESSLDLTPFITAANVLVSELLDGKLPEPQLKEVERWLAAHFVAIRDPRVTSASIGQSQFQYQGQTGMRLKHTSYGQQAMVLDTTGKLEALGKPNADFRILGAKDR